MTVLSYDFWIRRFGGDPGVVGRPIVLNQTSMTIIGIAPRGFRGMDLSRYADVIVPLMMKPQMVLWWPAIDSPVQNWLHVYARLRPGVSLPQAAAYANVIYHADLGQTARLVHASGKPRQEFLARQLVVLPGAGGHPYFRTYFGMPLQLLMGTSALVLLIACANLAGLLSARAAARRTKYAIRLALGAGRARVMRQSMVESLLLSLTGCLMALPISWLTASLLLAMLPFDNIGRGFHSSRCGNFSTAISCSTSKLRVLLRRFSAPFAARFMRWIQRSPLGT